LGLAVDSTSAKTTVNYSVTGTAGQQYAVDFFAIDSQGAPAARFLGTADIPSLSPGAQTPFMINIPSQSGLTVTATTTGPDGSTSPFAASPFVVINTNDSGPGSLRQAIKNANDTPPPTDQTDRINFDIPGTDPFFTIRPVLALPPITVRVT